MSGPPQSEYTQRKIYVSNVSAELDPRKLLEFFSKFGEIEEGPLGLDKQTGKPRGFCLFVYKSLESAKKALEEPHKNYEGHMLHCQKAVDGRSTLRGTSTSSHIIITTTSTSRGFIITRRRRGSMLEAVVGQGTRAGT
ncbi:ubp1-associated protein 2a [Phtheirospermum japonicum]|uniref:Ubp1-associated protein 2a n=1 Tax=Phtheirospermum japonicum TaxID=374723 RepID=A0A830C111_9LAMI|nr:ubp1-associated protein 2a [Phtheirospermum japonicum]